VISEERSTQSLTKALVRSTKILVVLTVVLVILTLVLVYFGYRGIKAETMRFDTATRDPLE